MKDAMGVPRVFFQAGVAVVQIQQDESVEASSGSGVQGTSVVITPHK